MKAFFSDIWTVVRKEWLEWFGVQTGKWRRVVDLVVLVGVLGIGMPLAAGPLWASHPLVLLMWAWLPMFLVASFVADSFAGERERGTLEALLASRLPDWAIVFGKVTAAAIYGWLLLVICFAAGAVAVRMVYGLAPSLLQSPALFTTAALLGALVVGFTTNAGVLISLRAATVRQAQYVVTIALLVLVLIVVYVTPSLAQVAQVAPGGQSLGDPGWLPGLTLESLLWLCLALAILDSGLLAALVGRFRRARLLAL